MNSNQPEITEGSGGAILDDALVELQRTIAAGEERACEAILENRHDLAANRDAVLELIYTEFVLREERGNAIPIAELVRRFPHLENDLLQLFQVHEHFSQRLDTNHGISKPDAWSDSVSAKPADLQIGRYRLLEFLGRGAGGEVFSAQHASLGRIVALKIARRDADTAGSARDRFRFEAEAAAQLQHPNIVQIHEVGVHEGRPFIAMEFVRGGNLAAVIRKHPLPPITAARIIECLARATHFAHQLGIVHRDLKPANVLLAPSDGVDAIELDWISIDGKPIERIVPKITDFGLAKQLNSESLRTLPGVMLGTPCYMAPEQADGESQKIGPACDVYALGAILYDMLVGRPPFHAATVVETLQQVKSDEPVSIRNVQPDVPRDLETICLKCLQKDSQRRYPNAADLAADLARFIEGRPILARPIAHWERGVKLARRHPAISAMLVSFMLAAIGISWQLVRAEWHRYEAEQRTRDAVLAREAEWQERKRLQHVLYAHEIALAQHELSSNYTTRARQLLAGTSESLRHWEYDYLRSECQQELWEFDDFSMPLLCVAISRDKRWLASAAAIWGTNHKSETRIWDLNSGKTHRVLLGHPSSIMDVQFSPDGKYIATAGTVWRAAPNRGGKVILWDMETGDQVVEISDDNASKVAFSPDGKTLAVGLFSSAAKLYEIPNGREIRELTGHRAMILDLSFHPNGKMLATASRDGSCRVWNLDDERHQVVTDAMGDIRGVDFSPTGNDLAVATFDGMVTVFRKHLDTYREIAAYAQPSRVARLRYSPDGQYLAVANLGQGVELIDPLTGRSTRRFPGHNGDPKMIAFSVDGQLLATVGTDGRVKVWEIARPTEPRVFSQTGPFFVDISTVPNKRWIAIAQGFNTTRGLSFQDKSAKLFDLDNRRFTRSFLGNDAWLTCIDVDPAGKQLASGSDDGDIYVWDLESSRLTHRLDGHSSKINDVTFDVSGETLISCDEKSVRFWNVTNGSDIDRWEYPNQVPIRVRFLPSRNLVAIGFQNGQVQLRRPSTEIVLKSYQTDAPLTCLASNADGSLLAIGNASFQIELLDVERMLGGEQPRKVSMVGHTDSVTSLDFSADGNRVVSVSADKCVKLWDLASGREVLRLTNDDLRPDAIVCFDSTGQSIVSASSSIINVWTADREFDKIGGKDHPPNDRQAIRDWHISEANRASRSRNWYGARFHLDQLLQDDSENVLLLKQRGLVHAELGNFKQAAEDLEPAFRTDTDSFTAYHYGLLGLTLKDERLYREARTRSLELLESHPSRDALNNAAWLCCLTPDTSVDWQRFASQLESSAGEANANVLNTIAAVCYRQGRCKEAIQYAERSLNMGSPEAAPFDWLFLALAHHQLGQPAEAIAYKQKFEQWWTEQLESRDAEQVDGPKLTWQEQSELSMLFAELSSKLSAGTKSGSLSQETTLPADR